MVNNLILTTYPFVIFSSLITAGIMAYAVAKTSDTRAVLRWLMVGVALVAFNLSLENGLFWYARSGGTELFNYVSNSLLIYTIKLIYGFGMWLHFCAAWTAIRGRPPVIHLVKWGALIWVLIYAIVLYVATT